MDIEKILKAGETERVEFKKIFGKETIVSLVAFANSRGGRVVVGIDDNGRIRGFPCGPETVQQCFNEIKVSMYPQLSPSIDVHEFQGKTLLVLEINEYPIKPVAYKNRYCKRVGNSSHALSLNEIVELQQQCLNLSFDAYPLEEDLSSLDHDTMVRFFERVNGIGRANLRDDPLGNLTKLKIIKNGKPTLAAMLLFGNLTIEDLERDDYIPAHRNRLLAEAFYLTGDIEKYGTGFIRVRRMLHECGEFTLSVGAMGDFFKVEVSAARTSSLEGTPEKTGEGTPTKTGEGTPTKTGEGTPTKTGEGTPTKTGEGTPTKTGEGTPTKTGEGPPTKTEEGTPEKIPGKTPEMTWEPLTALEEKIFGEIKKDNAITFEQIAIALSTRWGGNRTSSCKIRTRAFGRWKNRGLVLNAATWIPGLRYIFQSRNSRKNGIHLYYQHPGHISLRPE